MTEPLIQDSDRKQQDVSQKFLANPFDRPQIDVNELPKHNSKQFKNYFEIFDGKEQAIGFTLTEQSTEKYIFDQEGGQLIPVKNSWYDEKGCYYDSDGNPGGWMVYNIVDQNVVKKYFYDIDGIYLPSHIQEGDDDVDSQDDQDQQNHPKEDDNEGDDKEDEDNEGVYDQLDDTEKIEEIQIEKQERIEIQQKKPKKQLTQAQAKYESEFPLRYQANPFDTPQLEIDELPRHEPEKFKNYFEIMNEKNEVMGFTIDEKSTHRYLFDQEGGWQDDSGCYYDSDGQPQGWMVYHVSESNVVKKYFYDIEGNYLPLHIKEDDVEEQDDDEDNDDNEQVNEQEINNDHSEVKDQESKESVTEK